MREGRVAGSFDAEAVFDTRDLEVFARFMLANKGPLENLLEHEVRSDILRKPAQQLGLVLRKIGLGLIKSATVKIAGRKIRRYQLDGVALARMTDIVARREQKKGWEFLADRYGPHMSPSDGDDWSETEAEIERVTDFVRGTTGDITRRDENDLSREIPPLSP